MWRYALVVGLIAVLVVVALGCGRRPATEPPTTPPTPPSPTPTATPAEFTYACPMHPEVTSNEPGQCTAEGCTAFLVAQAPEGQEVEYVCDMHDQPVVSDEPGKCEQCGMFLKARVKAAAPGDAGEPAGGEEESEGAGGE